MTPCNAQQRTAMTDRVELSYCCAVRQPHQSSAQPATYSWSVWRSGQHGGSLGRQQAFIHWVTCQFHAFISMPIAQW